MPLPSSDKDKQRYYLLPGMGGRAARRKRNKILLASICVGLVVSAIVAAVILVANR